MLSETVRVVSEKPRAAKAADIGLKEHTDFWN